jgi:hypothetical protein
VLDPIDLTRFDKDDAVLKREIAERLEAARRIYPQIPGDRRSISAVVETLAKAVLAWRAGGDASDAALMAKLGALRIKGMGSANELWPKLFALGRRGDVQPPDWSILWNLEGQTGYGGEYPHAIAQFLESFLGDLARECPAASILDIGTGNCAALLRARKASATFKLLGIDLADLNPPPADERIEVRRMSANALQFQDRSFDAALSVNGIEYGDRSRAFPELFRILRGGGWQPW